MKLKKILLGSLALLSLVACSNSDVDSNTAVLLMQMKQ